MNKKIKVRIANSSGTEAFSVAGVDIERNQDKVITMSLEKANALVSSLSGIDAVSVSFVADEKGGDDLNAFDAALLEASQLREQLASMANLEAANADLEAQLAAEREKVANLEALLAEKDAESNAAVKEETPEPTQKEDIAPQTKPVKKGAK